MNNTIAQNLVIGLEVSAWGLVGVFGALLLFFFIMIGLDKIKEKDDTDKQA